MRRSDTTWKGNFCDVSAAEGPNSYDLRSVNRYDMSAAVNNFLVEHGFFKSSDLEGAHHVLFDDASVKMPEGTKSAFEAMINFLRARADSQRS